MVHMLSHARLSSNQNSSQFITFQKQDEMDEDYIHFQEIKKHSMPQKFELNNKNAMEQPVL